MIEENVIECKNLWKKYRSRISGIKSLLIGDNRPIHANDWILKNISFELKKGDSLGIIGENGVGKSTLLSILHGTISPDKGSVMVKGDISGLIELGSGFHPDLTGKDNIFNYGTILGLRNYELKEKWFEIATFAELENVMDKQLRTYSNGMVARLAFATMVFSTSNILLIDEILAVGDQSFKEKCKEFFLNFQEKGGSLIIVSHERDQLKKFCNKGLYLRKQKDPILDNIGEILKKYDIEIIGKS